MNLPPLSDSSQDLIAAERARDDADERVDPDRLLSRIRETVVARSKARPSRGFARLARRPAVLIAAALILAAGAAAAKYLAARSKASRPSGMIVEVLPSAAIDHQPSPTVSTATLPEAPAPMAPQPPRVAIIAKPTPSGVESAPSNGQTDLASAREDDSEEAQLIADARASLEAHAIDNTLRSLYLHERKFRYPKLSEQREILFVQALVAAHRTTEARQRFIRFAKAYPSSPAIPSLATLVGDER